MKKLLIVSLLIACGGTGRDPATPPSAESSTEEESEASELSEPSTTTSETPPTALQPMSEAEAIALIRRLMRSPSELGAYAEQRGVTFVMDWTVNDSHGVTEVCDTRDAEELAAQLNGPMLPVDDSTPIHCEGLQCMTCPRGGDCDHADLVVIPPPTGRVFRMTRDYRHSQAVDGAFALGRIESATTSNRIEGRCEMKAALRATFEEQLWHMTDGRTAKRVCGAAARSLARTLAAEVPNDAVCDHHRHGFVSHCSYFRSGRGVSIFADRVATSGGERDGIVLVAEGPPTCDTCGPAIPNGWEERLAPATCDREVTF
ncbi:MAG: hypothetical protein AAGE52_40130 [Myxococcota bacterium]